ncbi:MAG: flagellin [Opitutaceae bacterium]|jgi:flagellin
MSVVINTNTAASIAANNLSYANNQLTDAINQLSSGSRLADPASDPGDVGVSLRLTSQADNAGVQNTLDQSQLANDQTTSGAINVIGDIVTRISELSTMVGGTSNASDIANYNAEFTSLNSELTTLNADAGSNAAITSLAAATDLSASGTSGLITAAITAVGTMAATNAAAMAKVGFQSQFDATNETNLQAANSAISDVDVAQESTQLARFNVLVQAGTAMLAQANQTSQIALKLLQ